MSSIAVVNWLMLVVGSCTWRCMLKLDSHAFSHPVQSVCLLVQISQDADLAPSAVAGVKSAEWRGLLCIVTPCCPVTTSLECVTQKPSPSAGQSRPSKRQGRHPGYLDLAQRKRQDSCQTKDLEGVQSCSHTTTCPAVLSMLCKGMAVGSCIEQ